jgi:hypothetical protein
MTPEFLQDLKAHAERLIQGAPSVFNIRIVGYKSSKGAVKDLDLMVVDASRYRELVDSTMKGVQSLLDSPSTIHTVTRDHGISVEEFKEVATEWLETQALQKAKVRDGDVDDLGVFTLAPEEDQVRLNHTFLAPPHPAPQLPEQNFRSNKTKIKALIRSTFALRLYHGKVVLNPDKYEKMTYTFSDS